MKKFFFYGLLLIFLALANFYQTHSQTLTDSLVAYYPFDGDGNDYSGHHHHASIYSGDFVADRSSKVNSALRLYGLEDFVQLPLDFDYPSRTINIWFKAITINSTPGVIYSSDHSLMKYGLTLLETANISGEKLGYGEGDQGSVVSISNSTWYMFTIIVSPTFSTFYMNGSQISQFPFSNNHNSTSTAHAVIGCDNQFHNFFNGIVDDVRIYNRELSSAEVHQLYNLPSGIENRFNLKNEYFITCNPEKGEITFEPNAFNSTKDYVLNIYDCNGRLVLQKNIGKNPVDTKMIIPVFQKMKGIFIAELKSDNGSIRQKFIVF